MLGLDMIFIWFYLTCLNEINGDGYVEIYDSKAAKLTCAEMLKPEHTNCSYQLSAPSSPPLDSI